VVGRIRLIEKIHLMGTWSRDLPACSIVPQTTIFFLTFYFSFSCQFSFHRLLHTHHHLSSGAGTIGQIVADVPSGLSLTQSLKIKLNKKSYVRVVREGGLTRVVMAKLIVTFL
jgi:hypothetical protein